MTNQEKTSTEKRGKGRPSTRSGTEKSHTFRIEESLLKKAKGLAGLHHITLNEAMSQALQAWVANPSNQKVIADFAKDIESTPKASPKVTAPKAKAPDSSKPIADGACPFCGDVLVPPNTKSCSKPKCKRALKTKLSKDSRERLRQEKKRLAKK